MIAIFLLSILSIDSIVNQPELHNAHFGIYVLNLSNDSLIYARNCSKLLVPASNMKLVSTAASLYYLGPDFRFKTRLGTRGEIKDNKLLGDIVIIGEGDPTFSLKNLAQFVSTIKNNNIMEITGNIILDDSYFTELSLNGNNFRFERLPVGWAWHYLDARYAPEISALSINKNCVNVKMEPTELGENAKVTIQPTTNYVTLISDMITKSDEDSIIILRRPERNVIYVGGGIVEGRAKNIQVAVRDPAMFMGHYFKEKLADENVKLNGKVLRSTNELVFTTDTLYVDIILDSVISAPLIDILRETNIESVNLYAEILLKTLGAQYLHEGSFRAGLGMLKRFLKLCGADPSSVSLWDGSGLSRHNLISPYYFALVLRYMYLSKFSSAFFDLLPTSGEGTLEKRFKDFDSFMRAKTGSLHAVSCLSGYLRIAETDYCFSMMFNNYTCPRKKIEEIQEGIIFALQEQLSPPVANEGGRDE